MLYKRVKIRELCEKDVYKVIDIHNLLFSHFPLNSIKIMEKIKKGARYFVAEIDKEIIGFVDVKLKNKDAVLSGIGVEPRYEGKGIGRELLLKGIEVAKGSGKKRIWLRVKIDSLKAIRLYARHGFIIKRMKNGKYGSMYIMCKELEN